MPWQVFKYDTADDLESALRNGELNHLDPLGVKIMPVVIPNATASVSCQDYKWVHEGPFRQKVPHGTKTSNLTVGTQFVVVAQTDSVPSDLDIPALTGTWLQGPTLDEDDMISELNNMHLGLAVLAEVVCDPIINVNFDSGDKSVVYQYNIIQAAQS